MKQSIYEVMLVGNDITGKKIIVPIGSKTTGGEILDFAGSYPSALVLANLISLEKGIPLGNDEKSILAAVESGAIDMGEY